MYFPYSTKKGAKDIISSLFERFSLKKIYKKIEYEVALELSEEQLTDFDIDDMDSDMVTADGVTNSEADFNKEVKNTDVKTEASLQPDDIKRAHKQSERVSCPLS